jgi:exopolysaccharide biosynthesis polyprenyl glycosylphosphotransferase
MSTEATEQRRPSGLPPVVVGRPLWESSYALALVAVDAVMVTVAFGIALVSRFGAAGASIGSPTSGWLSGASYAVLVGLATPAWVVVLAASRAYEARYLGVGSDEFKRVTNACVRFGALLAFASYATRAELARGFMFVAVPLGAFLLLAGRYAARKVLHRMRLRGAAQHRVVAVGSTAEVVALATQLLREPHAGMRVVAVCLPDYELAPVVVGSESLVLLGPARALAGRLAEVGADTVAVAGNSALSSRELRELAWELEGTGVDLVVAPALTDVAGPRIHVRPVAGLPLLHVEEPTFGGVRKIIKGMIDLALALSALLLLLVPGLAVAALIKRDSPGPVFYRQERVGKDGRPFRIWKFRTMRTGADLELAALAARNEHDGPLFKIKDDPRVTSVGKVLRRLSIDELPQLLNVLNGSMSLVGPRPPLQREVDLYADHVHRRLLVKPGMTGLWQVSGRADLEWEEAVRLDLYYVENWSVALDFMILWKTVFAVLQSDGAY